MSETYGSQAVPKTKKESYIMYMSFEEWHCALDIFENNTFFFLNLNLFCLLLTEEGRLISCQFTRVNNGGRFVCVSVICS